MKLFNLIFGVFLLVMFLIYTLSEPTLYNIREMIFWGIMYVVNHIQGMKLEKEDK